MVTRLSREARIPTIARANPNALRALIAFSRSGDAAGVPQVTHMLVDLRASQVNGCSVCVDMHARELKDAGQPDEKIFAVAAWQDSPLFDDAERAALALAEAGTRLADRADPVPDEIWDEAARHYDEAGLAALVISIAAINTWNRLNAITRQPVSPWR